MRFSEEKFTVEKLVESFSKNALLVNHEYQRGAAWSEQQQAAFVDSILRGYPIPAIFLREIEYEGLRDERYSRFELIDGQQRLRAVHGFVQDHLTDR